MNWKKIGFALFALTALLAVITADFHFVSAAQEYTPLVSLPGVDKVTASNLPLYLIAMFRIVIGLAAVIAVVQITIGGVEYMSTDAISGKQNGKERITQAIIGLILAIGAWIILYTVNPQTVELRFNPPPAQSTTQPATTTSSTRPQAPVQIEAFQKVKICQATDPLGTVSRKTILASFPFTYADNADQDRAYNDCVRSSPPNRTGAAGVADCPSGFNRMIITCQRVLDLNAPVEEETRAPATATIRKELQCKQRNTLVIVRSELDTYTYNPAEPGARQQAMDLCTSSDPSVRLNSFPDHCSDLAQSETIICLDGPNQ